MERLPVPRVIWESLEISLMAESRRLVNDIAKTLGKEESELWKEISKTPISAYLVDITEPTDETFTCRAYCLSGPIQRPCHKPVLFGKTVCPEHAAAPLMKPSSSLPKFRRVQYYDEELSETKECYLNPSTNEIYDKDTLTKIGVWNTELQELTLTVELT